MRIFQYGKCTFSDLSLPAPPTGSPARTPPAPSFHTGCSSHPPRRSPPAPENPASANHTGPHLPRYPAITSRCPIPCITISPPRPSPALPHPGSPYTPHPALLSSPEFPARSPPPGGYTALRLSVSSPADGLPSPAPGLPEIRAWLGQLSAPLPTFQLTFLLSYRRLNSSLSGTDIFACTNGLLLQIEYISLLFSIAASASPFPPKVLSN